jgi:hypothetical protein
LGDHFRIFRTPCWSSGPISSLAAALASLSLHRRVDGVNVNTSIPEQQRRVPFANMIYIADGPSDIPSLSLLNQFGGSTFGVYQGGSPRDFEQAKQLLDQRRVHAIGPADYGQGSDTCKWLLDTIAGIADRLARSPAVARTESPIAATPAHIYK